MMKRTHWILLAGALLAFVGVLAWVFRPQAVRVEVAEVRAGLFERLIEEDGKTRVRARYVASAPLAGRLARVQMKAGDAVQVGTVIAVLWPSAPAMIDAGSHRELSKRVGAAAAAVEQARANSAREQAALEKARVDLARLKKLQGEGFLSLSALDQAELVVRMQSKSLEAARFARDGAAHDLAQARAALMRASEGTAVTRPEAAWPITSPVNGSVLRVLQEGEAAVAVGTPLVEVANADELEVVVDVLPTDATQVYPGALVRIDAGSGVELLGRVRRVELTAFTKVSALGDEEQRVNVVIDFDATSGKAPGLGDAYRVDVRIVTFARDDATVVPVAALFRRGNDWAVFALEGDRARLRTVGIGGRNDRLAWVDEGLHPGERVIVYPSDGVQDGRRVRIARGS